MRMQAYYRNLPVARKVQLAGMLVGLLAAVLGSAWLLIDDQRQARESMRHDVEVLAEIFSANSTAALTFNDSTAAMELLETLHAKQHIMAAFLYSADVSSSLVRFRTKIALPVLEPEPFLADIE